MDTDKRVQQLAPLAVLFQFQTGIRIGEVCAVRYEDLINPDYITIQRMVEDVLKYCRELAEAEKKKEAAENVKTDR